MAHDYSSTFKKELLATSSGEPILVALEIYHKDLETPIRVVNDSQNLKVIIKDDDTGNPVEIEFIACPFEISLPSDVDQQVPIATLTVDNIGRELIQWLEYSGGGKNARCRILQTMRSLNKYTLTDFGDHPGGIDIDTWNPFEYDLFMDMTSMSVNYLKVKTSLGFFQSFEQPSVLLRYDPKTAPGMW